MCYTVHALIYKNNSSKKTNFMYITICTHTRYNIIYIMRILIITYYIFWSICSISCDTYIYIYIHIHMKGKITALAI